MKPFLLGENKMEYKENAAAVLFLNLSRVAVLLGHSKTGGPEAASRATLEITGVDLADILGEPVLYAEAPPPHKQKIGKWVRATYSVLSSALCPLTRAELIAGVQSTHRASQKQAAQSVKQMLFSGWLVEENNIVSIAQVDNTSATR